MADTEGKPEDAVEQTEEDEEPTSEEPSSQGDGQQPAELASQLMQNPQVLAALQDRLGSIVGGSSGYIQSLPKAVKRRIKALKKLQFEATKIEAEFYREVHRLECEYAVKYVPLMDKRATMVTGVYEPNDDEADWPSDDEKDDELADEVKNKVALEEKKEEESEKTDEKEEDSKGIPGFWLTIFKNVDMLSEMIQPHDEAILNLLHDVKVEFKEKDPMGFTLEFYFDTNDYFENKKLTKEYIMRSEPDETDPFSFEGPEIVKCNGCKIDWKKGKNVTVKTVKKKQKHKASGTTRTISKTVQSDSFFNFFSPPTPPDDEEMDEDTEALLAADFEIGHFIRERIVPRAVLYFTGEALENDDEFEDGEEEEGGEEGEYDEDADGDYNPAKVKFVSRSFQERCAELALGRFSLPSSAPCDTRMRDRPNSGSAIRRDATIQTDISSRPTTAPVSSPHNIVKNDTRIDRPKTNTSAFSDTTKSENRPKTVTLGRKVPVGIDPEGIRELGISREGTEILLPNALVPQTLEQPGADLTADLPASSKIVREKTFFHTPKTDTNKNMSKIISEKKKPVKAERVVKTEDVLTEALSESAESEEDEEKVLPQNQKIEQRNSKIVAKASSKTKPSDSKETELLAENDRSKNKRGRPKQVKLKHSSKSYEKNKEPENVKDTAHLILQRLTGKHPQFAHKAGHVPSVGKSRRRYKFNPPPASKEQNETDKPAESIDDNPITSLLAMETVTHKQQQKYKDPPRMSSNNKFAGSASKKHGISSSAGVRGKNPSINSTSKPVSAPPQKLSRSHHPPKDGNAESIGFSKQSVENTNSFPNSKSKMPLLASTKHVTTASRTYHGQNPKTKSGVGMQNGLISTSLEESKPAETGCQGDTTSIASGHSSLLDVPNLHPKLQTSPYLRDNPLLQSGKRRRKPSAGLGQGGREPAAEDN